MTKLEETNAMLHSIHDFFKKDEIKDYEQLICPALLDIAKSLAIIADNATFQSEQMEKQNKQLEKIEDDLRTS